MAQHKKKPTGYQIEAVAKAHHKNEFLRKLKIFVNNCCNEDIFTLIPPKILEVIYTLRCRSLTIVKAADNPMSDQLLNNQRHVLSVWLKKDPFKLLKYNQTLFLDDFLTVGLTASHLDLFIKENAFPNASRVKAALFNYCNDSEPGLLLCKQLYPAFEAMSWYLSDLGRYLYWLNYELKLAENGKLGVNNIVQIHRIVPESIRIKINGITRPVIRMCWAHPFDGLKQITLKPSLLGIKNTLSDEPMPVYIQSHVLRRLLERIDSLMPSMAQFNMIISFQDPKVFYDGNHNLMIEYRIFETKAGYFRIDINKGVVVVRTFLFLTQTSTPEGQLLWKNTGLQKLDKKYLALDKLSSFMSSDIGENESIRKIFNGSGCHSLLELYERYGSLCIKHPHQQTCKLMIDYLGDNLSIFPEEISDNESQTPKQDQLSDTRCHSPDPEEALVLDLQAVKTYPSI
jgi:hypothetical protein